MASTMANRVGTQLEKDYEREIKPMLDASLGGTLRRYTDLRTINGESRVVTRGTPANYQNEAPQLYGNYLLTEDGLGGKTQTYEVTPHYIYGWEQLTREEVKMFGGRIGGGEWFLTSLVSALEIGEDLEIFKELERMDALIPAENKFDFASIATPLPVYHSDVIELLKVFMVYANSRFKGKRQKLNVGAVLCIHAKDWAKLLLRNDGGHIFSANEYKHMTGVDGLTSETVNGVAIEKFDDLDRKYGQGAGARNYYLNPGTARMFVVNNILGACWENETRRDSVDSLANGDMFRMVVSKSMGFKVIDPKGLWLMKWKPEEINVLSPVKAGESGNPIFTQ